MKNPLFAFLILMLAWLHETGPRFVFMIYSAESPAGPFVYRDATTNLFWEIPPGRDVEFFTVTTFDTATGLESRPATTAP